jgi:hypothetical protein
MLVGINGRPFVDLESRFDTSGFDEMDDEICFALAHVQPSYTGGSHKTMGIVPPSLADDPYVDYGQVIRAFDAEEFRAFIALSDTPYEFDVERRHEYEFGEEREHPLSRKQMLFLKYKHRVYFPWKVFYELIPGTYWDEKSSGQGKDFTREAKVRMPKTVAWVKKLPFQEIGRCILLGLEANDHGTVHRDGDPAEKKTVDHFITFCPRGNKRLYLWDEEARSKTFAPSRVYWFNDSDYHGVEADPFFRYSIRVDGVFETAFAEALLRA